MELYYRGFVFLLFSWLVNQLSRIFISTLYCLYGHKSVMFQLSIHYFVKSIRSTPHQDNEALYHDKEVVLFLEKR